MSSTYDRRRFLERTAVAAGALASAGSVSGLMARSAGAAGFAELGKGGYGALVPTVSVNTGETLIALPEGFSYTVFGKLGDPLTDGRPTPGLHDGMAAYLGRGRTVRLVRNHEYRSQGAAIDPAAAYDPLAQGGCTTVVVDRSTRLPLESFVSISGTHTNCAGGPTPWGTWVTCEETTVGTAGGYGKAHGYNFEIPAEAAGPVTPVPLNAMGRFVHEAIAVDPDTGWVYQTEDRGTSGIYRFKPRRRRDLASGGTLEQLKVRDAPNYDTRTGQEIGKKLRVEWVSIDDPDPASAEADSLAVFNQGQAKGGAIFARLEGAWYGEGRIYFHSTSGGDLGLGQVWELRPKPVRDVLQLVFESPSTDVLDAPDNITVSPRGGLVLCEDGGGESFMRGLTRKGEIFDVSLNLLNDSEWAGACFSPDGETLFANLQSPGMTFAIWGPWREGAL